MLSSVGFQTAILCLFACLLTPTQSYYDHKWWYGKTTCTRLGWYILKPGEKHWNETFSYPNQKIPEHFDAREKWPECESIRRVVKELENCPHSWAIITATMLTDRLCIQKKGKSQFEFSVNDILTCCTECVTNPGQCSGGYSTARKALEYWAENGTVSGALFSDPDTNPGCKDSTTPAAASDMDMIYSCREECSYVKYNKSYYIKNNISYKDDKKFGKGLGCMFEPWDTKQVQSEIMTNGPVATSLSVTYQFRHRYKGGVYEYEDDESDRRTEGWTVVKIIGWGVELGLPYWLAANCWGDAWGEKGFFKILRDENVYGFESEAYTAYFHDISLDNDTTNTPSCASILNGFKFNLFTIFFSFLINYIQHILI